MKKVLFLAPAYKYTRTTVQNVAKDLNEHRIGYVLYPDSGNMRLTTDNVEVEFVYSDPVKWTCNMFQNCEYVFGKRELVLTAMDNFFDIYIRVHTKSLSRYLIEMNRTALPTNRDVPAKTQYIPSIKNVYFNDPMTIVIWDDGTKTLVKCQDGDNYFEELGLAMCISKKALGNKGNFNNIFKKWVPETKTTVADVFTNSADNPGNIVEAANSYLDNIFDTLRERIKGFRNDT